MTKVYFITSIVVTLSILLLSVFLLTGPIDNNYGNLLGVLFTLTQNLYTSDVVMLLLLWTISGCTAGILVHEKWAGLRVMIYIGLFLGVIYTSGLIFLQLAAIPISFEEKMGFSLILLTFILQGFLGGIPAVIVGYLTSIFFRKRQTLVQDVFKPRKCPKCGIGYLSNPRVCYNCGFVFDTLQNTEDNHIHNKDHNKTNH